MAICVIAFWLGAWLLVRAVTRQHDPQAAAGGDPICLNHPARLLDERLARGDIDLDDYLDRRGLIADFSPQR